jgi:hypothetical protein
MVVSKYQKTIYLDRLDQRLIEVIDNEGSIRLSVLPKEYPEFVEVPSSTLWYRASSLGHGGYIRVERRRHGLVLHSVEQ